MRNKIRLSLLLLSLGILYWPGIQQHWYTTRDPYFVPFDAVQYSPPFFKFDPKDPIPTSYIKEYYLNAVCPLLYKWVTILGAQFSDVRYFQLALMYVAYAVFICVMGRIGWVLGGAVLSFAILALSVTAWIFIGLGFIGGAPRMFAYPLASLALYSLVRDRPYLLAATAVLGGLLYPTVGVINGACLATWMGLRSLSGNGTVSRWRRSRRLTVLGLTGLLTLVVLIPLMLGSTVYGRRIVESDIGMYPEAGPEGGYQPFDRLPYKLFGPEWAINFLGPMYSHGDPIAPALNIHKNFEYKTSIYALGVTGLIVILIILCGMKLFLKRDRSGTGLRAISFFATCFSLHVIGWFMAPYLFIPNRYLMFSLPFIITLLFPWSLYVLVQRTPRLESTPKLRSPVFVAIICIYLLAFGGRGNVNLSGFSVGKSARSLFDALEALPNSVIIAGWPVGPMRQVEYVTRRNVFLTVDIHHLYYLEYVKVMRQRMDALFDAYLSTGPAPLYRLRHEFGVTHLLVEAQNFTDTKHPLDYFAPWRERVGPRLAEIKGKEYLMNRSLHEKAALFNQDGYILLDLAKLP
jgi:hypothetical protein